MLDFYLLADDKNVLSYPEAVGSKIIGSIDYQTFERLKAKNIIPERFDYHSDFRWDTALIRQIKENIKRRALIDSDIQPLLYLLDKATENNGGLVAYAD